MLETLVVNCAMSLVTWGIVVLGSQVFAAEPNVTDNKGLDGTGIIKKRREDVVDALNYTVLSIIKDIKNKIVEADARANGTTGYNETQESLPSNNSCASCSQMPAESNITKYKDQNKTRIMKEKREGVAANLKNTIASTVAGIKNKEIIGAIFRANGTGDYNVAQQLLRGSNSCDGCSRTLAETTTARYNGITTSTKANINRRQYVENDLRYTIPSTIEDIKNKQVLGAATRFTAPPTTTKKNQRTTPRRVSFAENCDYLAHYCLKAYETGKLCGRTLYFNYYTFKSYCLLDYVNCMERYEVWQVAHMGECFKVKELSEYFMYPYDDDFFLDQYYVFEGNK